MNKFFLIGITLALSSNTLMANNDIELLAHLVIQNAKKIQEVQKELDELKFVLQKTQIKATKLVDENDTNAYKTEILDNSSLIKDDLLDTDVLYNQKIDLPIQNVKKKLKINIKEEQVKNSEFILEENNKFYYDEIKEFDIGDVVYTYNTNEIIIINIF